MADTSFNYQHDASITASQLGRFVKSNGAGAVALATAAGLEIGVVDAVYEEGDLIGYCGVLHAGRITMVAGGVVLAGDRVTSDSEGRAVPDDLGSVLATSNGVLDGPVDVLLNPLPLKAAGVVQAVNSNITSIAPAIVNTVNTNIQQINVSGAVGAGVPTVLMSEASSSVSTTSATDQLLPSMTRTPVARTYLVVLSGHATCSANGAWGFASIYMNGQQVAASERTFFKSNSSEGSAFHCVAKVTVNGSQAIEGRWRVTNGSASCSRRQMSVMEVA